MDWYEAMNDINKDRSDVPPVVVMGLAEEHLSSLSYLLKHCVRNEHDTQDTHWNHLNNGLELAKIIRQALNIEK
tara:strand:- start:640 stop:861 length:222 start_codon:yes stop_codon:yes gene_type:complete